MFIYGGYTTLCMYFYPKFFQSFCSYFYDAWMHTIEYGFSTGNEMNMQGSTGECIASIVAVKEVLHTCSYLNTGESCSTDDDVEIFFSLFGRFKSFIEFILKKIGEF